jgi:hypothetical protein
MEAQICSTETEEKHPASSQRSVFNLLAVKWPKFVTPTAYALCISLLHGLLYRQPKKGRVFCVACGVSFDRKFSESDPQFIWYDEKHWYCKKFELPPSGKRGKSNVVIHWTCLQNHYNPLFECGVLEYNPNAHSSLMSK